MTGDGLMARLERAERDIEKLDAQKADSKDVARLVAEFQSLRKTLQWFMGIVATAVVAFLVLVVQLLAGVT
jgi:hypothetical protein